MMFIEIRVNSNSPFTKIGVHRTNPSGIPNIGTLCSYDIYLFIDNKSYEKIGSLDFPYGDGNLLTIEVLKFFTESKN